MGTGIMQNGKHEQTEMVFCEIGHENGLRLIPYS